MEVLVNTKTFHQVICTLRVILEHLFQWQIIIINIIQYESVYIFFSSLKQENVVLQNTSRCS